MVRLTWPQALAWRMRRHELAPSGRLSVVDVVRRLCGVQAQVASSAELAVRVRRVASRPGEVDEALAAGAVIRTWAMRGTLHLLAPDDGAALLSLIASGRSWARPSWQRYFGVTPDGIERLRETTREILAGPPLTRDELIEAIVAHPGFEHIGDGLRSGWGTLLKPLAWQGDLCFGPSRGQRVTFTRPDLASPGWRGLPEPAAAAPRAIEAYLRAYGPATADGFSTWLAGGWFGRRRLHEWFAGLGERVVEVDVDGERAWLMAEDVDEVASTVPGDTVRLLPGFDQYVLGPGTADPHVIPTGRRAAVSRQSGWIAPVAVAGGVVSGTWSLDRDVVRLEWFGEAGEPPRVRLGDETERLSGIVGRELGLEVTVV